MRIGPKFQKMTHPFLDGISVLCPFLTISEEYFECIGRCSAQGGSSGKTNRRWVRREGGSFDITRLLVLVSTVPFTYLWSYTYFWRGAGRSTPPRPPSPPSSCVVPSSTMSSALMTWSPQVLVSSQILRLSFFVLQKKSIFRSATSISCWLQSRFEQGRKVTKSGCKVIV